MFTITTLLTKLKSAWKEILKFLTGKTIEIRIKHRQMENTNKSEDDQKTIIIHNSLIVFLILIVASLITIVLFRVP